MGPLANHMGATRIGLGFTWGGSPWRGGSSAASTDGTHRCDARAGSELTSFASLVEQGACGPGDTFDRWFGLIDAYERGVSGKPSRHMPDSYGNSRPGDAPGPYWHTDFFVMSRRGAGFSGPPMEYKGVQLQASPTKGRWASVSTPSPTHDYSGTESEIRSFIDRINACSASPDEPIPDSWRLPAPGADATSETKSAYESYLFALDVELPSAVNDYPLLGCGGSSGGGSATDPNGGDPNASPDPAQDPSSGGASFAVPDPGPGSSPYGQTAYQPSQNWQEGGTYISNPFGPPPPPPDPEPSTSHGAKFALGGLAIVGVLLWVGSRRKRSAARSR